MQKTELVLYECLCAVKTVLVSKSVKSERDQVGDDFSSWL